MLRETRHAASLREVPALRQKLLDKQFPNAFLHPQLIVQKVISDQPTLPVHAVNPHPVAIAVSADDAYLQIIRRNLSNCSLLQSSNDPIGCAAAHKAYTYALDATSHLHRA